MYTNGGTENNQLEEGRRAYLMASCCDFDLLKVTASDLSFQPAICGQRVERWCNISIALQFEITRGTWKADTLSRFDGQTSNEHRRS